MTQNLDAALALARLDWHVFPIKAGHKGGPGTFHVASWKDEATTDPQRITDWWSAWPDANIGVSCEPSGLAVIDVDDNDSFASFIDEHEQLPTTLTAETPRGGTHYIYAGEIKTTASKLAPGIDTRGRGGYFVAPPSTRDEGDYRWIEGGHARPLPDWLAALADPPQEERAQPVTQLGLGQANDRWGQRVLDGEVARVATAPEGQRNQTLFAAACKVFEAVKGGHVDRQVAHDQMEAVGLRIGLDRDEVRASLDSAWGRTDPRDPVVSTRPQSTAPPPSPQYDTQGREVSDLAFDSYDPTALAELPPPDWLLPNLLPEGLTFLIGKEKVGKTFVALDWSATVAASGRKVLYFAAEGVAGFAQRVTAWGQAHPTADISGLRVVPVGPQLLDRHHQQRLYTTVRDLQPALVVFDTWSRCTSGADENSHGDTSTAIGVIDKMREAYGTSTLVVHHTNAAGERPRGHSSIGGAVEAMWQVRADAEQLDAYHLACVAMKDAPQPPPHVGRIAQAGVSAVAYPSVYDRQAVL